MKKLATHFPSRFAGLPQKTALSITSFLALTAFAHGAVVLEGPVYVPSGANYRIIAAQGIDASTPLGKTGFSPQVNRNFEFNPSIGVSYSSGATLTNFGLGLYANGALTQSTGLNVQFNQPVLASSASFTVMDFDIKANDTFYNPNKVEPGILIFGTNNNILASLTPENIFPAMTAHTGNRNDDIWDINIGQLLTIAHLPDSAVGGFFLYADSTHGERPNSDPYLLLSVGNGITVVPEPATYLGTIGLIALLLGAHAKAVLKRNRA